MHLNIASIFSFWLIIIASTASISFADTINPDTLSEIRSSPNPVGSGARALGMGSAFIAVADDATAASWNPGGLIQLERPEVSVVGAYFNRMEEIEFGIDAESPGSQSVSETRLNYLSAAYPFRFRDRNMIVSINYQNLYDFSSKRDFSITESSEGTLEESDFAYRSNGSISAIGIAYAIQILPSLSIGMTVNIWEDAIYHNEWREERTLKESGTLDGNRFVSSYTSDDTYSLSGLNMNLGMLWNINSQWTLGAVLKTPFDADLRHEYTFKGGTSYPDLVGFDSYDTDTYSEDGKLTIPISYGIGFAYRYSDTLTFAGDIYWTEWDNLVYTDSKGDKTSPISGRAADESDVDPTFQLRLGTEYLFIKNAFVIPVRGGVFYDPAPAEGNPDDFYGFSLGSGLAKGGFIFDMAYQYRFGNDVGGSAYEEWGFSSDVAEHTIYSSIIVHF